MWKYFATTLLLIPLVLSDHISSDVFEDEYYGRGDTYRKAVREDDLEKRGIIHKRNFCYLAMDSLFGNTNTCIS